MFEYFFVITSHNTTINNNYNTYTMENIDVDGTPFSVLFDRAVKLKQLQTKCERIKYDSYPAFIASTIYPNDEVAAVRLLPTFNQRLEAANDMKQEGNTAFRDGRLEEALIKYESAVAIFRYLENTNDNWKKEGIKDVYIIEKDYQENNEEECQQLDKLLVNCYNNIAIVSTKQHDFSLAIEACDYAIAVDTKNDKSFFLRAKARLAQMNSGADDQVLAKSDLQSAILSNPNNKQARRQLERLNHQIKQQKMKDKRTFKGMFDQGELYRDEVNNKGDNTGEQRDDELIESKQRDIIMGRQLVQLYEERGMNHEKTKLEDSLKHEIQAMEQKEKLNSVDFHNPTDQMIKDAKAMGVDLRDSQTIELLEQMKSEHISVGKTSNIQPGGLISPPITSQTRPTMIMWLIKACLCIVGCAFAIIYLKTGLKTGLKYISELN